MFEGILGLALSTIIFLKASSLWGWFGDDVALSRYLKSAFFFPWKGDPCDKKKVQYNIMEQGILLITIWKKNADVGLQPRMAVSAAIP